MAKNQETSQNLENSIKRIEFFIQKGFTKKQIADMADIKYGTLLKIASGYSKDISDVNHEKIKRIHSDYIIRVTDNALDDEPVFDPQDVEDGANEVTLYVIIFVTILLLAIVGLGFIIKYIIGLF